MIKEFYYKNINYIVVILIFIVLAAAYFSPALNGFSLKQGDVSSWKAAAKELVDYRSVNGEEAIWTNSMFSGMPGYFVSVKNMNGFTFIDRIFSLGLSFTQLPISVLFIAMLSFFILGKTLRVKNLIAVLGAIAYGFVSYHVLIIEAGHNTKSQALAYIPAVLGMFLWVYRSNKNILLPAALFTFFMGLEIRMNHIQMTYYFAFILIAIGGFMLYEAIKEKTVTRFATRSLILIVCSFIALMANFNEYYNMQSYAKHSMRGVPEITINPDGSEKVANQSGGLDRDYIVNWCYGKQETYNLLVPNAKGDSKNQTNAFFDYLKENNPSLFNYAVQQYQSNRGKIFGGYWGDQPFTSGANYIGAIIVLLAFLYLVFVKTKLKWALLLVSILAIMLSWGKNLGGSVEEMWLTNFFIDYVPLYNKFRTVSSILVIVNLTFPLMSILFLNHIYENLEWAKANLKKILIVGGSLAGVVLLFALMPNLFDFTSDIEDSIFAQLYQTFSQTNSGINPADAEDALRSFRIDVFKADSYRTLMFLLAALALLFLWISGKVKYKYVLPLLTLACLVDIWDVDKRYLNNEKNPNNKREYLAWEKGAGYGNTFVASAGDKQIYQIESSLNPKIEQLSLEAIKEMKKEKGRLNFRDEESARFSTLNLNSNYRVLNLDNPFNSAAVSYFHKSPGGYSAAKMARYQDVIDFYLQKEIPLLQNPEQVKVLNMLNTKYYLYQGNLALQNPYAYGNAWFVEDVKFVNHPNEEILSINDIDPKKTAIVNNMFKDVVVADSYPKDMNSTITLTSYAPNQLAYQTKSAKNQLAIFSEVYYEDGWNAYVDGEKVKHFRANYILRGLPIPAGDHLVEFKFEPSMYRAGNAIGVSVFLLIMAALIYGGYREFKLGNPKEEE